MVQTSPLASCLTSTAHSDLVAEQPAGWSGPPRVVTNGVQPLPTNVVAPVYQTAPWVGNRTFAVGGTSRRMSGTARKVDGGWMIKGVWPFATGSVHASHGYLAVFYDEN